MTITKSNVRPNRPLFQMYFTPKMLEVAPNMDKEYEKCLLEYFQPYYKFVENLCLIACEKKVAIMDLAMMSKKSFALMQFFASSYYKPPGILIDNPFSLFVCNIAALIAHESLHLNFCIINQIWLKIAKRSDQGALEMIETLLQCDNFRDYFYRILYHARHALNSDTVYEVFQIFISKVRKSA